MDFINVKSACLVYLLALVKEKDYYGGLYSSAFFKAEEADSIISNEAYSNFVVNKSDARGNWLLKLTKFSPIAGMQVHSRPAINY